MYADSLRGVLNWQANYMDSKFGPDGALYVQVYQGFFSTGPQAGLYRFAYTGGADTPNPDPQWSTTGTAESDPVRARLLGRRRVRVGLRRRHPGLERPEPDAHVRGGRHVQRHPHRHLRRRRGAVRDDPGDRRRRRHRADHRGAAQRRRSGADLRRRGRGDPERERRHRGHRRRVDRVQRRRRRLHAQRQHGRGRAVRHLVHRRR